MRSFTEFLDYDSRWFEHGVKFKCVLSKLHTMANSFVHRTSNRKILSVLFHSLLNLGCINSIIYRLLLSFSFLEKFQPAP